MLSNIDISANKIQISTNFNLILDILSKQHKYIRIKYLQLNKENMASLIFQNSKSEEKKFVLTFFTSTFNRKDTIGRTYDSLLNVRCPKYDGKKVTFE